MHGFAALELQTQRLKLVADGSPIVQWKTEPGMVSLELADGYSLVAPLPDQDGYDLWRGNLYVELGLTLEAARQWASKLGPKSHLN